MALSKNSRAPATVNLPPPATTTVDNNIYEKGINTNSNGSYDMEKAQATRSNKGTGYGKIQMNRIGAPPAHLVSTIASDSSDTDSENSISIGKQVEMEAGNAIKYRTCSWQKTAALLFSEYICLAIMSFPYSYSVLGLVPGLILTVVVAALVLYT